MFYLSSSYTVDIHETIKKLLLHCPTQHLTWYGNIYFDAWKNAKSPYVEVSVKCVYMCILYGGGVFKNIKIFVVVCSDC